MTAITVGTIIHSYLDLFPHDWLTSDRILLLCLSGSRAYGINTEDSDWDVVGMVQPPEDDIIGLGNWKSWQDSNVFMDGRAYSPEHYVRLLRKGSPNHLETLWLPTYIRSPILNELFLRRSGFITKGTLMGILGNARSTLSRYHMVGSSKHGEKRRTLIETRGYDTSSAAHAIRWLWMGLDLRQDPKNLTLGLTGVRAQSLRRIKAGETSFVSVDALLREQVALFEEHLYSIEASLAPMSYEEASELLMDIHRRLP